MTTVKPVDLNDYEEDRPACQRRDITREWRPVSVRLPPALHDAAICRARTQDTTVTDVIRRALRKDLGIQQATPERTGSETAK